MAFFTGMAAITGDDSYLLGGVFAAIVIGFVLALCNSHTVTETDAEGNIHTEVDGFGKGLVFLLFLLFACMCLLPIYGYFFVK